MKKVRFVTPTKAFASNMNEYDCHSPRPTLEQLPSGTEKTCFPPTFKTIANSTEPSCFPQTSKTITYSTDPLHLYEYTNASPNPLARRTDLVSEPATKCYPTNELDLTMLDGSSHEPRNGLSDVFKLQKFPQMETFTKPCLNQVNKPKIATPLNEKFRENVMSNNVKENSFFIRRDNVVDLEPQPLKSLQDQLHIMKMDKENIPLHFKTGYLQHGICNKVARECNCYHCNRDVTRPLHCLSEDQIMQQSYDSNIPKPLCNCIAQIPYMTTSRYQRCSSVLLEPDCYKHKKCICSNNQNSEPENALDKKNWAIKKFENTKKSPNLDIDKQKNVTKEKREPTVADLFKIIKLQNEQLQLLQEKVDKFISAGNSENTTKPIKNYVVESAASETVIAEKNKISIGVMTSFEVVRTSTIINKEIIKKSNDNPQIQCNRSQISIKEVVSKAHPISVNFLDGLSPKDTAKEKTIAKELKSKINHGTQEYDEKTLNEQSLYNVQVDNATTPLMSPDQTLYLDVRDYSDSDSGSDQSNIGWTYYNKVMTHVNGMLQDSDMPSSASGLWRNTRQQCMQMQIDKTNVSVMKRVQFGEEVIVTRPTQNNVLCTTDTSFKMKQLAAKYLQSAPSVPAIEPAIKPKETNDMSLATRNYMERHQIIQGTSSKPAFNVMPRFLDITALKQQPKFL